ncbi:hypothetical protein [Acidianus bottle-shaped virus]|uniref:Uncharacterized protein ORF158 n=1 Tax=Acidianus bottle-shaped virus (isolate Italy/Pozzuoli) TaxID=654911 RepID=Y158_ABVP|nr:hypothetical protein ABV_gp51 [Acidianus bottle-shaped virus]A4ZUD7.1 RecName: Full=Uncharacterized protein ORF158 [Acidianus bottle-shaped virus (isolate Pozzuoli)]ABP73441.1 hypothetical protein [Acidianus bottle-shaped virus]
MNKTLIGHLDVSSSNLNNLAYKIYSTIKGMIENFDMVDKRAIVYMLKTYKEAFEITLSDFEFVLNELPTEDKLYPYIDYLVENLKYGFDALDELIYIVDREFDERNDNFKNLIKETLSFLQDITYCVHNWIKELRDMLTNTNQTEEEENSNDSESEED